MSGGEGSHEHKAVSVRCADIFTHAYLGASAAGVQELVSCRGIWPHVSLNFRMDARPKDRAALKCTLAADSRRPNSRFDKSSSPRRAGVHVESWGPRAQRLLWEACGATDAPVDTRLENVACVLVWFAYEQRLLHSPQSDPEAARRGGFDRPLQSSNAHSAFAREIPGKIDFLITADWTKHRDNLYLSWAKRVHTLLVNYHTSSVILTVLSVIGGAFSTLGRQNRKHAERAGMLALQQIALARRMGDEVLESKCCLYYAEHCVQTGKFMQARSIIDHQAEKAKRSRDRVLEDMAASAANKLEIAICNKRRLSSLA